MAAKKPSLANLALNKGTSVTPAPVAAAIAQSQPTEKEHGKKDDRIGQTLRLPPGAHKQLKRLAVDVEKPVHDLLIEAVNDLFTKYGKPPIA
jgi:hypothetical protein